MLSRGFEIIILATMSISRTEDDLNTAILWLLSMQPLVSSVFPREKGRRDVLGVIYCLSSGSSTSNIRR
jgi:hypothetical protein